MHSVLLSLTQKYNPYHDEKGRFATHQGATFISAKGFEKLRKNYVPPAPKEPMPDDLLRTVEGQRVYKKAVKEHDKALRAPPPSVELAVRGYTGPDYGPMNSSLRAGEVYEHMKPFVADLDVALSRTSAPEAFMAYRGVQGMYAKRILKMYDENPEGMVGVSFADKGFTSTTVNKEISDDFSGGVVFRINVPKGQPGAFVEGLSGHTYEKEFLMPRDTALNVRAAKMVGEKLVLDVDILPKERREDRTKKGDLGWTF